MFNLHLDLDPQVYSVTSDRGKEPREALVFHGSYAASSDVFQGPNREEVSDFYVRIVRADQKVEPGIIRCDKDRPETLQVSIEMALPELAFARVAQGVARGAIVRGSFRDDFFDESARPFTRQDGHPTRLVLNQSKSFALALAETTILVREREAVPTVTHEPVQAAPRPVESAPTSEVREQLAAIRTRLTFVAVILLGLLFYAAK
ncbi:hypothetical protein [Achromobacter xylosoxidans]|uniref:hypothetical protein n=1 Tax=Alcaligenes xylosoxydans xylosoxydans TaxID=85698 RepID=UPI0038FC3F98